MKLLDRKNFRGMSGIEIEPDYVNWNRAQEIINELQGSDGRIYPIPYSFIKNDTLDTLNVVMQSMALYTFPTVELCEWLEEQIDEYYEGFEPAIEICAGTGWIGRQLGIPITDIKAQENPVVKGIMRNSLSIPVLYADDTEQIEACEAVKKYNPEYVIGSYVTSHKNIVSNNKRKSMSVRIPTNNGYIEQNLMELAEKEIPYTGVNVEWIIKHCHKLFLICNLRTHFNQSYLKLPHQTYKFDWLVTRGDKEQSRVIVFENKLW